MAYKGYSNTCNAVMIPHVSERLCDVMHLQFEHELICGLEEPNALTGDAAL